jgi:hypothetical protein
MLRPAARLGGEPMFLIGIHQYPATIAAGQSLSGPVPMGVDTLVGIEMPAAWTAAPLTFQVSPDGGTTWQELYDGAGNEVTILAASAAAGRFIQMTSYMWRGINMLRVRSGTAGAPVAQSAGAVVTLIGRQKTS